MKSVQVCVLTSGGDSQGMNAAIRAIVRRGMVLGANLFGIHNGYQGLVDGGHNIKPLVWDDVSGFLSVGGTFLGSSRCLPFKDDFNVRTTAVKNMIVFGIDRLIVIGGDGSLSGAHKLSEEWPQHIKILKDNGTISEELYTRYKHLYIVGIPGSIDNDMWGTDLTIGCDTALHRIAESLNSIMTTASSHQRVFVVEIMGRNCGYLALMSALSTGADYVFIPECPAKVDWRGQLVETIQIRRKLGARHNVIIVAEGAVDVNGTPIKCTTVKKVIEEATGADTRETILGHVQRGGAPSALDRYTSTILGLRALEVALEAKEGFVPVMVGVRGGITIETNLTECVKKTRAVTEAMAKQNYEEAFALRDYVFREAYQLTQILSSLGDQYPQMNPAKSIGIFHVGSPCSGMNAAVRSAARSAIAKGYSPILFYNGFVGISVAEGIKCGWRSVANWAHQGGAHLGSNRELPSDVGLDLVADTLRKYNLCGLIIIGGWTAYISAKELRDNSHIYPEFQIPIVCVPASIGNNCPGTDLSIGCDTALNVIVNTSDAVKSSGLSSRRRIFIVEVMGSFSGYLALAGGISAGAHTCYTPEQGITLEDILRDVQRMKARFTTCRSTSLILNGECASSVYSTSMLKKLYQEESEDIYDVRMLILGHVQQGNSPSPYDRILASLLGNHAVNSIDEKLNSPEKRQWIGSVGVSSEFGFKEYDFDEFESNMDYKLKVVRDVWWKTYFPLVISSLQGKVPTMYRPLDLVERSENDWDPEKHEIATTAAGVMKKTKEERELEKISGTPSRQSIALPDGVLQRTRAGSRASVNQTPKFVDHVVELFSEHHSLLTESDPTPTYHSPTNSLPSRLSSRNIRDSASAISTALASHAAPSLSVNIHPPSSTSSSSSESASSSSIESQSSSSSSTTTSNPPQRTLPLQHYQQPAVQQAANPLVASMKKRDMNKVYKSSSVTELIHGKDLPRQPSHQSPQGPTSPSQSSGYSAAASLSAIRTETFDNFTPTLSPRSSTQPPSNPFPTTPRSTRRVSDPTTPNTPSKDSGVSSSRGEHVIVIGTNTLLFGATLFGFGLLVGYFLQQQRK